MKYSKNACTHGLSFPFLFEPVRVLSAVGSSAYLAQIGLPLGVQFLRWQNLSCSVCHSPFFKLLQRFSYGSGKEGRADG